MRIHIGCEMSFDFPQETPLIAMLNVHYSRASDLERPDFLTSNPPVPIESYRDSFGNWCNRFAAPPRPIRLWGDAGSGASGRAGRRPSMFVSKGCAAKAGPKRERPESG